MTVPILETTDVICSSLYLRAAQGRISHTEGSNDDVLSFFAPPESRSTRAYFASHNLFTKTSRSVCNPTE